MAGAERLSYSRHIPVAHESDVLVAGGGPAGVAAALAAALMVESDVDSRGVEVGALQARLKATGGFLPNCA
jgi:ribulose 1,5-bisphosphate synthetase/thiazole synthase